MSIERLTQLHAEMGRIIAGMGGTTRSAAVGGGKVAPDADLDDPKWGDQEVRFNPRAWSGEDYKGARWSECPPEFLDALAAAIDEMALKPKPGKEQYAKNDFRNAERVRAWAKRKRDGWQGQPKRTSSLDDLPDTPIDDGGAGADDDIPFAALDERAH